MGKPASVSPGGLTPGTVQVRRLAAGDSISAITKLLHRAYADQVAMGLQPLAGRQGDEITAERCSQSECWLAVVSETGVAEDVGAAVGLGAAAETIVGVILFEEKEKVSFPEFFLRPEVAHFAQFAVDPDRQGLGIGRLLLEKVEERAREGGYKELALSMAEPDVKLRAFYEKRGFRLVSFWQWPYTNYRSCILSKGL